MRVVQLIDSLEAGGAERMAVNFANALSTEISFSGLVVTRKLGSLQNEIDKKVPFLFLKRKKLIDFKAINNFKIFLKKNKIEIIHSHSSSFFFAVLVKIIFPKIRIIWHDHNGGRNKQSILENKVLFLCSAFFDKILVVNKSLLDWSLKNLICKRVFFIPNFVSTKSNANANDILFGLEGKRIVCLANLRNPKNHLMLLEAFYESSIFNEEWTLHLIGKDNSDDYSKKIKDFVKLKELNKCVYLYGSKSNIHGVLDQAEIGVLSSTYEGFPVTLLEYGRSELAVMSTNVGHCPEIIIDNQTGLLFDPNDKNSIVKCFKQITENKKERTSFSKKLSDLITLKFSEKKVIKEVVELYCRN